MQRRSLPNFFAQIDHTRAELLPEIDRLNLQILDFDEHRNLRRPHSNTAKARGSAHRDESLSGSNI